MPCLMVHPVIESLAKKHVCQRKLWRKNSMPIKSIRKPHFLRVCASGGFEPPLASSNNDHRLELVTSLKG